MQGSYTSILSHALAPNSPQTILIYLQITHTKSNFSLTIYNFIQKLNLLCSRLLKQHRITNETTKRRIRHKLNFNIKKGEKIIISTLEQTLISTKTLIWFQIKTLNFHDLCLFLLWLIATPILRKPIKTLIVVNCNRTLEQTYQILPSSNSRCSCVFSFFSAFSSFTLVSLASTFSSLSVNSFFVTEILVPYSLNGVVFGTVRNINKTFISFPDNLIK